MTFATPSSTSEDAFARGFGSLPVQQQPQSLVQPPTGAPMSALPSPTDTRAGFDTALGQSPAYLAFLRALGLSDSTDQASAQVAIDALNRRAGLSLENLAAQGARQRQGISDSMESRGLYRSGERLRAQSAEQEDEARQGSGVLGDTADQTAALAAELAQRRAQRQQQAAEHAYDTAISLNSQPQGDVYGSL